MVYLIAFILAVTPLYIIRFNIFGIPTTLLEISIYVVFLIGILKKYSQIPLWIKEKNRIIKNPFFIFLTLLFLSTIISTFVPPDLKNSLGALKAWFIDGLMVFLLVIFYVKNKKDFSVVVGGLSIGAFVVSVVGLWQYFTGRVLPDGRIASLYIYDNVLIPSGGLSNFIALYLVPTILLQVGLLVFYANAKNSASSILKFLLGFSVAVELFTLFLTSSYGGLIGLITGLLIIMIYKIRRLGISNNKKIIFAVLAGLAAVVLVFSQVNTSKFQNLFDAAGATSTNARLQIWQASWLMIKDNPISGIGLNNFEQIYREYIPKVAFPPLEWLVPHAHNLYLSFWLEIGIIGLVSFIVLMGILGLRLIEARTIFSITILAAMASILVHGLVDTPILKNDLAVVFWSLLAVGYLIGFSGILPANHDN